MKSYRAFQSPNRAVTTTRDDRSNHHVMSSMNESYHRWTNKVNNVNVMPSKLWAPHIINILNASYHLGTLMSSAGISYLPWPNHIVDERSISSRITSCHLRMNHFINERLMSSTCTSQNLTTHHIVNEHDVSSRNFSCQRQSPCWCQWNQIPTLL